MTLTKTDTYKQVFISDDSIPLDLSVGTSTSIDQSGLRRPDLETQLNVKHSKLKNKLNKVRNDYPEFACCSCERLHRKKSVSEVKLSDSLGDHEWENLKQFILKHNPAIHTNVLYMCHYCKRLIENNEMPARCVLNGLESVPIPSELQNLYLLSSQLIQCIR